MRWCWRRQLAAIVPSLPPTPSAPAMEKQICMYVCMYIRMYDVYVCTYVRMYVRMYVCVCMYVCMQGFIQKGGGVGGEAVSYVIT